MRQTPAAPGETPTSAIADVTEADATAHGTVAEIEPPLPSAAELAAIPPANQPATARPARSAAAPANAPAAPVSAAPAASRSSARVAAAPAGARVAAAPVTAPVTGPVAGPVASAPAAPAAAEPVQTTADARVTENRDTWPARESATSPRAGREPGRDADATSTAGDDALPGRTAVDEVSAAPAPVRRLETVTIPADAVIGVQLETGVSSLNARVEDTVRARVARDLVSGGEVVVPAGTRLLGSVTLVDEGGRVRERARLGIRFHTLVLADGTEMRLPTETIYRDGESVAGRSAAKIGGASVGGAILGAILGGGKGAVIGAATGAGSGAGWAMAGDRRPAELRAGQSLTVRVSDAVSTQVER